MKALSIHGKFGDSQLLIGEQITNLKEYLPDKTIVVITDTNINCLYNNRFNQFPIIEIKQGETTKNLQTIENIIGKLIELGADRHSFLLGIGGGVVCDITGFVASIFMRGIDFGFVSTSLLSQVDASIGGKNGVNFQSYKNIIGTFNQPQFVICDTEMLQTLPEKEIRSGFGEIIKHALIADESLFAEITETHQDILKFDSAFFSDLVYRNVQIKIDIVNRDEKESGERKKLNFGHTLGHAIEKLITISHGEAIILGMQFAVWWSKEQSLLDKTDFLKINDFLTAFGQIQKPEIPHHQLIETVHKDKKRNQDKIDFIFLEKIGKAIVKEVSMDDLSSAIETFFET